MSDRQLNERSCNGCGCGFALSVLPGFVVGIIFITYIGNFHFDRMHRGEVAASLMLGTGVVFTCALMLGKKHNLMSLAGYGLGISIAMGLCALILSICG